MIDRTPMPLVLVTVGTDHHPFERLIGWIDRWTPTRTGASPHTASAEARG